MPAQVVTLRRPCLDRGLVGQIGGHGVHRIHERHGGLRFKSLLPLLEIRKALRHRLVLFAKLLGLSLDIRELVGVSRGRERQDGCCRNESSSHFGSPEKSRHTLSANRLRSLGRGPLGVLLHQGAHKFCGQLATEIGKPTRIARANEHVKAARRSIAVK